MYRYKVVNDEYVGLHDCRANKMAWNADVLSFYIPDGIWVWKTGETIKTKEAKVDFEIIDKEIDGVDIYLFKKNRSGKVVREEWELNNFINAVNNGTFKLEFVYKYQGYQSVLYKCYVWFDRTPYHYECEMILHTEKMICRWN